MLICSPQACFSAELKICLNDSSELSNQGAERLFNGLILEGQMEARGLQPSLKLCYLRLLSVEAKPTFSKL